MRTFFPAADEVEAIQAESVEFFDSGSNFERVVCPACGSTIGIDWWHDCMDEDHDAGFRLRPFLLPCCGARRTLNELRYEPDQTFGRFCLSARNPNVPMLDADELRELELVLGTKLRAIHRHL